MRRDIACARVCCDYTTAVCKPLCGLEGLECAAAEDCVVGRDSAGSPIPGLFVCLAACNPISASVNPCADDPDATCCYRADEAGSTAGLRRWRVDGPVRDRPRLPLRPGVLRRVLPGLVRRRRLGERLLRHQGGWHLVL
ncbi:MAG: hypothetical protein IPG04_05215 [Polyangiaceae bacterium]|nr:hypothetical protein [Polyangiaceae bacterium]